MKDVSIVTGDGWRLAASFSLPEGEGPFPGILFCQGLSGTRSLVMPVGAGLDWQVARSVEFFQRNLADQGVPSPG